MSEKPTYESLEQRVLELEKSDLKRKKAEDALRESEERFRRFFMNAPLPYQSLDENGNFIEVNSTFLEILGYSQDEVIGNNFGDFLQPEYVAHFKENFPRFKAVGEVLGVEFEMVKKDGSKVLVSFNGKIQRDDQSRFLCTHCIFQDITERKRAEEMLKESEERLKSVLEGSQLGFWDWNIETGKVFRNAQWAEMLGYTLEEIELSVRQWTDLHHPDDKAAALQSIQDHLEGRTPAHKIEYRMRTKDGQYKWILDQAKITRRDPQGKPQRMSGTHTDITERVNLQAQLVQAQKMESVGRLAGGVAHDFNNMLSIILGYAELGLSKVDPSQSLHSDIVEIRKAANRSADLTRQLLAFARKQTISPKVLDLNETVEGMLKMLRRLIGEDIDLAWLPGKGLWQVMMDPAQMDQILANLCVNARDAISGVGKMTLETANRILDPDYCIAHPGSMPGAYVIMNVSDNGCGMDKETQLHIFEPFFTTKETGKGTGLGLATVFGIVKQNNGFINVYSEPEQGTTFTIYLPRHIGKSTQIQNQDSSEPAERGYESILLVEDEQVILKMTAMMLERLGYTVVAASTSIEAIRMADKHPGQIHLIMTDVVMPDMNGRDLVQYLMPRHPGIKSLYMSGYTANVIAHHGVLDPGLHFIQKPFSMKDLAAKVRKVLDNTKG